MSSASDPAQPPTTETVDNPQAPSQTNGTDGGGNNASTILSQPTDQPTVSQPQSISTSATVSQPLPETSTTPSEPSTTTAAEPTTTSEQQSTTTTEQASTTTTTEEQSSTTTQPTTTAEPTTEETITTTQADSTETSIVTFTTTREATAESTTTTAQSTLDPTPINPGGGGGSNGLDSGAKIAIGVVVPIVSIAILALVALFFWKKRRARRAAAEERRKEVEDYSYNPNADPTIPNVAMGGVADGGHELREDGSGYRGWGTTVAGSSTGRKASTTMSGGGFAYSDPASPTQQHATLARGDEVYSPEGEILGAMGPAAANNRANGVNRGPSNASSSYSAANRSDNSEGNLSYGHGPTYYDQSAQNPYDAQGPGAPNELSAAPVIRDNPARRNTRIENPSHYPQQSAGISQNF